MNTIRNIERLHKIHELIDSETTGTPRELARRMQISERLVYHLIEQLKDYDASIRYDRSRKTYFYEEEFELRVKISVSIMSNNETTQIFGGARRFNTIVRLSWLKSEISDAFQFTSNAWS